MKTYGVIMAGGGGTRFWPLSRAEETIGRISTFTDKQDIFIVTNEPQVPKMRTATESRIAADHILAEPAARNTSACIGYAALEIVKKYGDGIMCIFPSDHFIKNQPEFTRVLKEAIQIAEQEDKLITLGITPTFPSTGYGYIKFDATDAAYAKKVVEFKEKPDEETAKAYVASGEYAWNSGMFIWRASTILRAFDQLLPDVAACLHEIGDAMGTDVEKETIARVYPNIPSISIDYGIMEKSWDNLGFLYDADASGNVIAANHIGIDTTNSIVYGKKRLITTIGIDNLIVVETDDAILVCDKNRAQDVKKIVDELKKRGETEFL